MMCIRVAVRAAFSNEILAGTIVVHRTSLKRVAKHGVVSLVKAVLLCALAVRKREIL